MKIYVNLSKTTVLKETSGDKINEISLYKAMNRFASVYYNDQLFVPGKKNYGINPKGPIIFPQKKYDLYFVRNNPGLFLKLPSPKVYVGTPYHEECFKTADAVITYTEAWRRQLLNFDKDPMPGLYQPGIHIPKNVITFHQVLTPNFMPRQKHPKTVAFRKIFGGDFIIGHFGRMSKGTYPYSLLTILPKLKEKFKNTKITFIYVGGSSIQITNPNIKNLPYIRHNDMPYAISACDVVVCNSRQPGANWAGCKDVLEGMACGVPVLTGDYNVRKEQFGKDYELFWPHRLPNDGRISVEAEEIMFNHLSHLIADPQFGIKVGRKLVKRAKFYSIENRARDMERSLNRLLKRNPRRVRI